MDLWTQRFESGRYTGGSEEGDTGLFSDPDADGSR